MESKKRFTLDLDAAMQRRLKATAALKGISMRQYCIAAIEKQLERDQAELSGQSPFNEEVIERLAAARAEIFQGKQLPGDSTDFIREDRQARTR